MEVFYNYVRAWLWKYLNPSANFNRYGMTLYIVKMQRYKNILKSLNLLLGFNLKPDMKCWTFPIFELTGFLLQKKLTDHNTSNFFPVKNIWVIQISFDLFYLSSLSWNKHGSD